MSALGDVIRTANSTVAANFTTTDIAYENVKFNTSEKDQYIALYVEPILNKQMTINNVNDMYRLIGRVRIDINVKPDIGTIASADIAEELSKLFRSKDINGIKFDTPRYSPIGVINGFYQGRVDIPFYYDSIY